MAHPHQNLTSALYRAIDRVILGTIVVLPQYLRYRVHHALHAAELRRARRHRVALAGGSAVVAVGVVALRRAKQGNDQ
jgi:fumarate reductase subunit D